MALVFAPADNWWCFVDESVFSRMVDMYKSIVIFLLTGGKTLLVPVFYEDYFTATLRLLEKLHKVIRLLAFWWPCTASTLSSHNLSQVDGALCLVSPGKLKGPPRGVQPLLHP